tara:strand:- start:1 stop:294 length:294 start_codon:yes stop_codon:yes gene_type:complete
MQKNMQKLVGKFVHYHKPNFRWQFGKVKEVVLYTRGPKKGQLKYARIVTPIWTGKMVERDGMMIPQTRWSGPTRRTTKITEVLKGKNTWVPMKEWIA